MPSQSLSFLEQSLVPTLGPEDLWSRRHNPAPRLHPHRCSGRSPGQHSLGAGLDPEVQGKPWFGSLGEVAELYERAWGVGTSFPKAPCKLLHPRKAVWGLVSSVSLGAGRNPGSVPCPHLHTGALSESVPVRATARELLRKEETGFQEVSERNRPKGNSPGSSPALSLPAFCRGQDRPD